MKILFAASEAVPYIKSGGLADVIGDLPPTLSKMNHDISIILPLYGNIDKTYRDQLTFVTEFQAPVAWRQQYCGLFKHSSPQGTTIYFIDNEHYFKRPLLYGYGDDVQRYAFFSRAVLESLNYLDSYPHIIHCHDWQTALIPVYLKEYYGQHRHIKTLFTIHNLGYQGRCSSHDLEDTLGFPRAYHDHFAFNFKGDDINLLKAGLHYSDYVTTVSPTYAKEITCSYYGESLDQDIRELDKKHRLKGIINGIDYTRFPQAPTFEEKKEGKKHLQRNLGLPVDPHTPTIAIISRLVSQKGMDLITHVIHEILNLPIQLIVLGLGESSFEDVFRDMERKYPHKCRSLITFNVDLANEIYAGADILLMPSKFEPCGLAQLIAMRQGCIPLVRETGGLADTVTPFNQDTFAGNGFSFDQYNAHQLLFTLEHGLRIYENQIAWEGLFHNAIATDYSWEGSAKTYDQLYHQLCI